MRIEDGVIDWILNAFMKHPIKIYFKQGQQSIYKEYDIKCFKKQTSALLTPKLIVNNTASI